MIGASPSYSSTDHCTYLEADSSSSSTISSHSSCLPQHEACLRHMLSEEDRVVADGYRTTTRRRHSSSTSTAGDLGHLTVWRERVAQWVYTVVDHVDADRSAVYNVLLLLDAYLDAILSASAASAAASHNFADAAIDAPTYQLLAMSCLYLVLRLRDDGAHRLSIEQLVSMSRSDTSSSTSSSTTTASSPAVITPARIARTMKSIVRTLESTWRRLVFAPSPGEFVVAYVEQMQHHQHCTRSSNGTGTGTGTTTSTSSNSGSSKIDDLLQATRWSALLDDAAYLAELSVCDTYLRNDRPSVIAYAALLNVLRCHSESFAAEEEEEEANTNNNTLKQDLQSLRVLTGYVNVTKTTVKTIYSRLGYVQSQSLDAMAPTSSSRVDQQGVKEEAATNTNTTNIVPQDDDDEVEAEEEVEEREVVAVMAPAAAAAAIVSAATSPSSSTAATATAATNGGVKRRISAVVSYDELLAVVDATLPPASISSSSDSEEEEDLPMSSSSSSPSSSGMKRVRSYSSDLSSFAAPDDEVAKRTRLVESHE